MDAAAEDLSSLRVVPQRQQTIVVVAEDRGKQRAEGAHQLEADCRSVRSLCLIIVSVSSSTGFLWDDCTTDISFLFFFADKIVLFTLIPGRKF